MGKINVYYAYTDRRIRECSEHIFCRRTFCFILLNDTIRMSLISSLHSILRVPRKRKTPRERERASERAREIKIIS